MKIFTSSNDSVILSETVFHFLSDWFSRMSELTRSSFRGLTAVMNITCHLYRCRHYWKTLLTTDVRIHRLVFFKLSSACIHQYRWRLIGALFNTEDFNDTPVACSSDAILSECRLATIDNKAINMSPTSSSDVVNQQIMHTECTLLFITAENEYLMVVTMWENSDFCASRIYCSFLGNE